MTTEEVTGFITVIVTEGGVIWMAWRGRWEPGLEDRGFEWGMVLKRLLQ